MVATCRCQEWQRAAVLLDQRRDMPSGTDVVSFNAVARSHLSASGLQKLGLKTAICMWKKTISLSEHHRTTGFDSGCPIFRPNWDFDEGLNGRNMEGRISTSNHGFFKMFFDFELWDQDGNATF